ncbi:MAG: metalloregulator ArsR/SmtB family transcription factor [Candidatus Riflebacteria bacterium]|nr:metalloregulator ArsR/SmtB family transcription factor [Candidatus Riflebacteria bacterium]
MKDTLNVIKILAEESRLRIFMALHDRELCVCQIVALLGLAASTTSKHLALMYQTGIIDQRKDGRWAYYSVSSDWCKSNAKLNDWVLGELKGSVRVLADAERLEEVLKMPVELLCQPLDQCFPEKNGKANRVRK